MSDLLNEKIESGSYGEIFDSIEKSKHLREKERKQAEFDQRILDLADKALEYETKDENMYVLLESFLEVAIEMKNLMETMSAINVAMETISDAVGFIDAAIAFDNVLMDESLANSYGFFARLKMRAKMRKTIRNNRGRVLAIAKSLEMKYKMATDMRKALSGVGANLKKAIGKKNKKAKPTTDTTPSAAKLFIAERKALANGGASVDTEVKGGGSSSSSSDISDIL